MKIKKKYYRYFFSVILAIFVILIVATCSSSLPKEVEFLIEELEERIPMEIISE
jgi:hypothetical protein